MVEKAENTLKMLAEFGPEFINSCKDYSGQAADIVHKVCRLAGLSEEAAAEIVSSDEMVESIALSLYSLTKKAVSAVNEKKIEINRGE